MAPLTHQLSADAINWEDQFLNWFAGLDVPTSERFFNLGGLRYHHFSSVFPVEGGRVCTSYGRSESRKVAAVKCAAEYVERKFMVEWFHDCESDDKPYETLPPKLLQTSNGWAVRDSPERALQAARYEALERHLLLKSFLKFGWSGFQLIESMKAENIDLYFLKSRFRAGEYVAGLVVAKSSLYPGVSFGYGLGKASEIQSSQFWESAIFEAIEKIQVLDGRSIDLTCDTSTWVTAGIKRHLESPFDLAALSKGKNEIAICEDVPKGYSRIFDLRQQWSLDLPLFAAYAWGGGLIPLFCENRLGISERTYLQNVLRQNGLSETAIVGHPIV